MTVVDTVFREDGLCQQPPCISAYRLRPAESKTAPSL